MAQIKLLLSVFYTHLLNHCHNNFVSVKDVLFITLHVHKFATDNAGKRKRLCLYTENRKKKEEETLLVHSMYVFSEPKKNFANFIFFSELRPVFKVPKTNITLIF